ncbi:MAG: glycosyltransferase [Pseudomonadota bacterium]
MAIASDAAPARNGVGAYYEDLLGYFRPLLARAEVYSPTIEDGRWHAGLVLPMPGDATQKLCFPNPWQLRRELAALAPDVVIVPTPGVYGMTGAFFAARWGIPLVIGFHTSFEQLTDLYWQGSLKGRLYRTYLERSHQYLFNRASLVLVNSKEMEDLARRMGAINIRRVGTPVPAAFARHPVVPCTGALKRVLFAGRLAAEKNIEAVILAAEQLPGVGFSIAGDGPLRSLVESAAGRLANVTYLGWLDRAGLRDQVDLHDALVLPSHFESFGTIALEAMSRQRMVIVSRGTGISAWDQLRPGFITIAQDQTLADSIRQLLSESDAFRLALARRAGEIAQAFNENNLADWERLLIETASSRKR